MATPFLLLVLFGASVDNSGSSTIFAIVIAIDGLCCGRLFAQSPIDTSAPLGLLPLHSAAARSLALFHSSSTPKEGIRYRRCERRSETPAKIWINSCNNWNLKVSMVARINSYFRGGFWAAFASPISYTLLTSARWRNSLPTIIIVYGDCCALHSLLCWYIRRVCPCGENKGFLRHAAQHNVYTHAAVVFASRRALCGVCLAAITHTHTIGLDLQVRNVQPSFINKYNRHTLYTLNLHLQINVTYRFSIWQSICEMMLVGARWVVLKRLQQRECKKWNVGMWKDLLLHRQERLHHRTQFGVTR